jgi:hypothetical protein
MNLIASAAVEVEYLDGTKETLSLRRLTIRQLYHYIVLLGGRDTPGMVALCADQSLEWIDTLTDKSMASLAARCSAENFQRAVDLASQDPIAASSMLPLFKEMSVLMHVASASGITGNASSPAPAASASAVETGSAASSSPQAGS